MHRRTMLKIPLLSVMTLLLGAGLAAAQSSGGVLRGQVTDDSGAIIPAAPVTVIFPDGTLKQVTTGIDGTYTLSGLTPGKYTVRVAFPGFSTFEQPVDVNAARTVTVNAAMHVSLDRQEVTVKADPGP